MRESFARRYALQPYIYTEARKTYDTGLALLHPLYYDWPEAPQAYTAKNEYMFGDSMLADPVTQPVAKDSQLAKVQVWLPPGDWFEQDSGASFHGPVAVERDFSISQIPLYVKAGSIIPMQPPMRYTGEKPVDPLILTIFPLQNGQASNYRLYDDAGNTPGYQQEEFAWTPIEAASNADGTILTLTIAPTMGHYPGMPNERAYEFRLPGNWPPTSVTVNDQPLSYSGTAGHPGWRFEGNTLTSVITTRRFSTGETITVKLRIDPKLAHDRSILDGFAGKLTRLREAYDIMNVAWPAAGAPNLLIDAMQTGDRIGYRPETSFAEVSRLSAKLHGLNELIDAMHATETTPAFASMNQDKKHQNQKLEEYNGLINTALAHIADVNPSPSISSNGTIGP
jgi:alpha-glucosidase